MPAGWHEKSNDSHAQRASKAGTMPSATAQTYVIFVCRLAHEQGSFATTLSNPFG
jgi:hypothetical protein